ncbi:MAG: hypothetical protein J0I28_04245 [Caulobacterales bacterium]|nr:hypothetical protein [Caulobacterales bacterium]
MADGAGKRGGRIALIVVTVALITAAVGGLVVWRFFPQAIPNQQDRAWDARVNEIDAIEAAKAAVSTRTPTAISLTFGDAKVNWVGDKPAVCGLVDIEEPEDSFVGQERFVYVDGQVTLEQADGTDAINRQWDAVCKSV